MWWNIFKRLRELEAKQSRQESFNSSQVTINDSLRDEQRYSRKDVVELKSAMKILTSFTNEIWDKVNK